MTAPMMMDWEGVKHLYRVNANPLKATIELDVRFNIFRWHEHQKLYAMLTTDEESNEPIAKQDVLRVSINEDGTIDIVDFTLPPDGTRIQTNIPQDAVPTWILEAVSMLRITRDGTHVQDLGIKMHDELYYVKRKEDA